MMTVAEAVRTAKVELDGIAGEESLSQAKMLVGFTLGVDEHALTLHHQMELTREQIVELGGYVSRRQKGEPLQYIIGQWSFMGLPFIVDARALIPRQDTETLCELALQLSKERGYTRALDLCCGSGCIGIALARLGGLHTVCADISADCLSLACENASLNDVNVDTLQSDLFSDIRDQFDMIVCNPPYLSRADMDAMQPELAFEPRTALYGGQDGLDFYRRIAGDYARCLREAGTLLIEIGASQADAVMAMFSCPTRLVRDVAGLPRVIVAEGI